MANESYVNGSVSVGTTATKVCTVSAENDDVLVSCSAATVFGGPSVTATTGVSVPATTLVHIPSGGGLHPRLVRDCGYRYQHSHVPLPWGVIYARPHYWD